MQQYSAIFCIGNGKSLNIISQSCTNFGRMYMEWLTVKKRTAFSLGGKINCRTKSESSICCSAPKTLKAIPFPPQRWGQSFNRLIPVSKRKGKHRTDVYRISMRWKKYIITVWVPACSHVYTRRRRQ